MTVIFYQGEDIYFRPIELEDEPRLRRWVNDPRLWSTLNHHPPLNGCAERKRIEQAASDGDYWFGIVRRADDTLVGTCALRPKATPTRRAEFGIMIGDVDAQNRGIGSAATELTLRYGFEEMNLHRIELSVLAYNQRAIRVYERAGFRFEGRSVEATYRHGRYHDVLRYAILRREWDALHDDRVEVRAAEPAAAEATRILEAAR